MDTTINIIDYVLITAGFVYSVENIEHVLGIVLLVIQICWLIFKAIFKLRTILRTEGDLDEGDRVIVTLCNKILFLFRRVTKRGDTDDSDTDP